MKFLIDAQLPPALARWLREFGHEAVHVCEVGLLRGADGTIWDYALQSRSILVTKDEDFATRSASSGDEPKPIIVWLRLGNSTNASLRNWFEARLPGILALVADNQLIEVV